MDRSVTALLLALTLVGVPVLAAHYEDAYTLQKEGKYAEAVAVLQEGLTIDPDSYNLAYLLGYCYSRMKEYPQSIDPLKTAVKVRPDSDSAWHLLGYSYMKLTDETGRAKPDWYNTAEAFRQASLLKPDNPQYNYFHGLALAQQKKYAEAVAPLTKAQSLKPDDFNSAYQLGLSLYKQRRYPDAIQALEMARSLNATHTPTLLYLGESLVGEKRYQDAIPVGEAYTSAAPDDYLAHHLLGKAHLFAGKYSSASSSFRRVTELKPKFPQGWYYFGQSEENRIGQAKGKNFSSAIGAYKKAVELNPDNGDYYYKLAHAYDMSGKYNQDHDHQALKYYNQCLKMKPNHARAQDRKAVVFKRIQEREMEG